MIDELHGENLNDRVKTLSPTMTVLKRFFRSKLSVIGLAILVFLFVFSFLGPVFSPWGQKEADSNGYEKTTEMLVEFEMNGQTYTIYDIATFYTNDNILAGISAEHWLGTDDAGWDVFTRLMYGGRISLTIGFVVVGISTLLGVILGGIAGYFGKWVDQLIMRIVDVLYCIPTLPLMLILSAFFDSLQIYDIRKLYYMMALLCLINWTGTARLVRGQILSLREQEFMLAAKCSGLSTHRKIFKHLIPNVLPQLIVTMTLGLGSTILTEATLGYLNLGAPLGTPTWGNAIQFASSQEYSGYLNLWVPAGACITLAILGFNFVGDGLRDAFDPKSKR